MLIALFLCKCNLLYWSERTFPTAFYLVQFVLKTNSGSSKWKVFHFESWISSVLSKMKQFSFPLSWAVSAYLPKGHASRFWIRHSYTEWDLPFLDTAVPAALWQVLLCHGLVFFLLYVTSEVFVSCYGSVPLVGL